jgi:hypothetical protein
MASEIIKSQKVFWDGYDLTADLFSVVLEQSVDALDNTTLGCTTRSNAVGLKTVTAQVEGYFNSTDYDTALNSTIAGSDKLITVCRNSTEGALAYFMNAVHASYDPIKGNVGELAGFSAGGVNRTQPLCRGSLLFNQSGLDASGNGTGQQLGAALSTQTIYAGLHILAVDDPADTIDVVIQSDDNSGFTSATSRITFSQKSAIGSEFKTLVGPVTDDYWRVNYTIAGSTPSFTAVVVMAILTH